MESSYIDFAKKLRKELHKFPEKSMEEIQTKRYLMDYLEQETQLELVDCGLWFYAVWRVKDDREYIVFRADYDAVTDGNGISRHVCGHDGHASILAVFGKWISDFKPDKSIILLFQPGEESGQGALLCKDLFMREKVKEIYGFHNIPGFPEGSIILKEGTFACASTGLSIHFQGIPSHAAYPENGINPASAIAQFILDIDKYTQMEHKGIVKSTVIGVDLGSESYGVSASEGFLRLTVRAEYQVEFDAFLDQIQKLIEKYIDTHKLKIDMEQIERFPSTENYRSCVEKLRQCALVNGLLIVDMEEPRRWSEDFGWYLKEKEGCFFGVGDGMEWPQLHTKSFEFNDKIIDSVLKLYQTLIKR